MGCKERDKGCLSVEAESIVVQVDGVEVRQVQDRGKERGEGLGDLVEQTTSEDIGEVRDLFFKLIPSCVSGLRVAIARMVTYLQRLLGGQYLPQALAGTHSQRVAQDSNLLNLVHGLQASNVWLEVLGCVQLQTLALKGEDLVGGCHNFKQMRSLCSTKERKKR